MKEKIAKELAHLTNLKETDLINLIEIPPSQELGDYSFPCFSLVKQLKKNPNNIASELAAKIISKEFEKIEVKGSYINFFINKESLAEKTLNGILKEGEKFGSSANGKGKNIVLDMSSPNIAKPFGIGHLRSTIIGNSIANISKFQGYKVIKLNYLGDWGTPFGKILVAYKKSDNQKELKKDPINYLYSLHVKANNDQVLEEEGRKWFKKLEDGDKEAIGLWKQFRALSIKEFDKIYKMLNIQFDIVSSESYYNDKMGPTIKELKEKGLLEKSEGAFVVNLEKYNLGVCLIQKSDGATLYATRDITAAIDRKKRYNSYRLFYEVGQEQKLHFKQFFKVLELMDYSWAKECVHIDHGLYLDNDGKKFATRHGKTIFLEKIIEETRDLAKKEIKQRGNLSEKELNSRAQKIALAAIFYGDLKNHRSSDVTFDINRFISFEGNTGPYLLYTYARARSILRKAKYKKPKKSIKIPDLNNFEKSLITQLSNFPEIANNSYFFLSPNLVANYSFQLAQTFNEFYHSNKVIGSENESFLLVLVYSFSQVLKNSLKLLSIDTLEEM